MAANPAAERPTHKNSTQNLYDPEISYMIREHKSSLRIKLLFWCEECSYQMNLYQSSWKWSHDRDTENIFYFSNCVSSVFLY